MKLTDEQHAEIAAWWSTFDGPAYPSADEVAEALAPLIEGWMSEARNRPPASCPECESVIEHCSACGATFRSWDVVQ